MQPTLEKKLLLLAIVVIVFLHTSIANKNHLGFGFDNEIISETIPFDSHKNLIIVKATLDGERELNLILDTGIRSLILFKKSYVPKISDQTFDIDFTAAGEPTPISALVSINHTLRLSKNVVANQINSVILERYNPYLNNLKGVKIHGAFGYQLFARFQVKIDYENKLITLSEPSSNQSFTGFEAIPIKIQDTKPFIETDFLTKDNSWTKLNLLLDLGANHKVLLLDNPTVTNLFHQIKPNNRIAEGLSSSIFGIKAYTELVRLGQAQFHHVELLIPDKSWYHHESIDIVKHGSIGGRLFEDSIIVVDYVNGLLLIENKTHLIQEYYDRAASG